MSGPGHLNDREPVIDPEEIDERVRAGESMTDIARELDVTPQNIHYLRTNAGRIPRDDRYKTPREIAKELFPWKRVGKPYNLSNLHRLLGNHAEYQASDLGAGMSIDKLRRLQTFYEKLRDEGLVVEFHPAIPASDYNSFGGYAYRPRKPSDGELIIRVNELAQMTPEAEIIWRFPRRLPQDRE